jgi:hypothetical protein
MACFDNLISIRELCDVITPQTYYLNQIGINAKEITDLVTSDYAGIQGFIDEKAAFAVRQVQADIYNHLSPVFKASSILAGSRIGHEADAKTLVTQSGMVGVEVKLYNPASFVDFVVSDVSLFTDYTGDIDVLVYDLKQGLLLDTVTVAAVVGQIVTSYEK